MGGTLSRNLNIMYYQGFPKLMIFCIYTFLKDINVHAVLILIQGIVAKVMNIVAKWQIWLVCRESLIILLSDGVRGLVDFPRRAFESSYYVQ